MKGIPEFSQQEMPNQEMARKIAEAMLKHRWLHTTEGKINSLITNGTGFRGSDFVVFTHTQNSLTPSETTPYFKFIQQCDMPSTQEGIVEKDLQPFVTQTEVYQVHNLGKKLLGELKIVAEKIRIKLENRAIELRQKANEIEDAVQKSRYMQVATTANDLSQSWGSCDWIPTVLQKMKLENGEWVEDRSVIPEFSLPPEALAFLSVEDFKEYKVSLTPPVQDLQGEDLPFTLEEGDNFIVSADRAENIGLDTTDYFIPLRFYINDTQTLQVQPPNLPKDEKNTRVS